MPNQIGGVATAAVVSPGFVVPAKGGANWNLIMSSSTVSYTIPVGKILWVGGLTCSTFTNGTVSFQNTSTTTTGAPALTVAGTNASINAFYKAGETICVTSSGGTCSGGAWGTLYDL